MGIYLNSSNAFTLYKNETAKPYFVDKSQMLIKLFPLIDQGSHYICITRPRRFGKTVMANMISSFLSRSKDSHILFDSLKAADDNAYETHINKHNVIHIRFNEAPDGCRSYKEYISRIRNRLMKDLQQAYSNISLKSDESVWDALLEIHEYTEGEQFIFILDEWDYIFHRDYVTYTDKKEYIDFLCYLLKDKAYVSLAYMTGILPVAKYSSGSELNVFAEFTMAKSPEFSDFFGFTERETDDLYNRYVTLHSDSHIQREDLQSWYNGYYTASGERVYNPRSVVYALTYDHLENYRIEREDKSGVGYADFIFYPKDRTADRIILELKADHTADEAIKQIKEKKYALRFEGKLAEHRLYTGRLLFVGIAYDRKAKKHSCIVETAVEQKTIYS